MEYACALTDSAENNRLHQAVPRQGDWYAKRMYVSNKYNWKEKKYTGEAEPAYHYHIKNYGHPSVFGYKDIIPLWKAERWKPDELMQLFKRVGARYFVSMAIHHDNFSLWDTKLNRWNSVSMAVSYTHLRAHET